jgi:hypothetical protein
MNTLNSTWKALIKLLHFRLSVDYSPAKGTQSLLMGYHKIGASTEPNNEGNYLSTPDDDVWPELQESNDNTNFI